MAGREADVDYMLEQLQLKVDEADMNGRVSTWAVPCNMLFIESGVEYAIKVLEGETNGLVLDDALLRQTIQDTAGEVVMTINNHSDENGTAKNHFLIMADFIDF